jgi:hypothetical protein
MWFFFAISTKRCCLMRDGISGDRWEIVLLTKRIRILIPVNDERKRPLKRKFVSYHSLRKHLRPNLLTNALKCGKQ